MEQLKLVERYLIRIRRMYSGNNSLSWGDRHFTNDDVYSFFIHCNHLRDWVLKLNKIGITKKDITEFIRKNRSIQICADLANSAKHCHLEQRTWSGANPHIGGSTHQTSSYRETDGVESQFQIVMDSEEFDALEIAEQCWKEWNLFIGGFK